MTERKILRQMLDDAFSLGYDAGAAVTLGMLALVYVLLRAYIPAFVNGQIAVMFGVSYVVARKRLQKRLKTHGLLEEEAE